MFPDLSYLSNYLFGTPVDNFLSVFKTFGLFLVFAFIASAYCLRLEFIRKRKLGLFEGRDIQVTEGEGIKTGELISNGIFGFILGWKVPYIIQNVNEFSQDPTAILFSMKGSFILGIIISILLVALSYYLGNKSKLDQPITKTIKQYPEHRLIDITMVAAFFGVLGSKLFSVFENWDSFIQDPIQQILSGSGLTIYGGLLLAFIAVYFYVQRLGIKPIHMMDAVAPALIMGYVVGRMGCQMSGDGDWGIVNELPKPSWFVFPDWMWSFDYPHNVVNEPPIAGNTIALENCGGVIAASGETPIYCTKLAEAVYPTPIYEIIAGLIIFIILWVLRTRFKIAGILFFIYVLLNGVERFFIEQIRVNPKYDLLGMGWSLSQWIAFGLFLTGLAGILYLSKYGKTRTNNEVELNDSPE